MDDDDVDLEKLADDFFSDMDCDEGAKIINLFPDATIATVAGVSVYMLADVVRFMEANGGMSRDEMLEVVRLMIIRGVNAHDDMKGAVGLSRLQ